MKKLLIVSALASAAFASSAVAEDFTATVGLGGEVASVKGNAAKFKEYRDIGDGLKGNFDLEFFRKGYYFDLSGEKFGYNADTEKAYNDQRFTLNGGKYGSFKYSAYYDETPHNFTFGAQSLFTGVGTTTLTAPVADNAAIATAAAAYSNKFDYKLNRTNYGAGLEASFDSPLFFSAKVDRYEVDGLYPIGVYNSNAKETPAPIDFATTNLLLQTGYKSKNLIATLDGTLSNFTNKNDFMSQQYTNDATPYRVYLPPDNKYYKFGGSVTYRLPFWDTALMARGSYSQNENHTQLSEGISKVFDGKITYTTASLAATSNPTKNLDTRAFANYLEKDNRSTEPFTYGGADTEKYEYDKINAGFEAGYKLPAKTKLSAGYEFLKLNRAIRNDARTTKDHSYFVQAKNSYLDWLTAKLRYQMLLRDSDNHADLETPAPSIFNYWRPVDTANKQQDTVKLSLDLEPAHNLAFGLEYGYKRNKYKDTFLGVKSDSRHELYLDANYTVGMFRFNPYGDVETVGNYAAHRRFQTVPGGVDPITGVNNNTNYNWSSKRYDVNYAIGLNTDVNLIKDKLTAFVGWRYEKADGSEEFTSTFATTLPLANNTRVDNYEKDSLTAKLTYAVNKNLNVGIGYLFEKLQYSDDHWTDYSYVPAAATNLTGAYANPDYEAHVGWVNVAYKF